jgi:hypothetical protein
VWAILNAEMSFGFHELVGMLLVGYLTTLSASGILLGYVRGITNAYISEVAYSECKGGIFRSISHQDRSATDKNIKEDKNVSIKRFLLSASISPTRFVRSEETLQKTTAITAPPVTPTRRFS